MLDILTCPLIVEVAASIVFKKEIILEPLSSTLSIKSLVLDLCVLESFNFSLPLPGSLSTGLELKVKSKAAPPKLPSCPDVPELPELPELPLDPELPSVPDVPSVPEVPELPDEPDVPDVPASP